MSWPKMGEIVSLENTLTKFLDPWPLCEPCFLHLTSHYKSDPDPPWQNGVRLIDKKEECLLEGRDCPECGESHENILGVSPPEDPCDSEYVEEISS